MRRLLPTARSLFIHSGQVAALGAAAVLAMAAAPAPEPYIAPAATWPSNRCAESNIVMSVERPP